MSASLSVIIPNLNSPVIGHVLEAVRTQEADPRQIEILVVGRDTPGLVIEDSVVRFLETEHPAPAAQARNRGLAAAILHFFREELGPVLRADIRTEKDRFKWKEMASLVEELATRQQARYSCG
jgi:hypothetical protein